MQYIAFSVGPTPGRQQFVKESTAAVRIDVEYCPFQRSTGRFLRLMQTTYPNPSLSVTSTFTTDNHLELHLPTLKVVSYSGHGDISGVPTSLEPLARRIGTKVHWLSVKSTSESSLLSDKHLQSVTTNGASQNNSENPPQSDGFEYYCASIPDYIVEGHRRLSANYLWPLLHGMPELARFDPEDWRKFRELCQRVASECQTISEGSYPSLCWLHDYQLALSAPLMATERGTLTCQFWHVPWPKAENIASSPVAKELIESLLANRLLGFHTAEYAHNFLATVSLLFKNAEIDHMNMSIRCFGYQTQIVVMPLGIDVDRWRQLASLVRPLAEATSVKHRLANQIVLGVDRLDYTKGVLEKLHGIEYLLTMTPDLRRRFHYVQISQKPQSNEEPFKRYADQVAAKIAELNDRFSIDGWKPVVHIDEQLSQEELAAWYQAADVLAVNSLSDGLNLIAKEFVACRQDEQGVLILSRHAGCASELDQGAIVIDPRSPAEFARAISDSFSMPVEEKRRRMTAMRHVIGWNQLHDWALGFLKQALK